MFPSKETTQVVKEKAPVTVDPTKQNTVSEERSGWKTYSNSEGNYSLMYPVNWTFKEPVQMDAGALIIYKGDVNFHNQYDPKSLDYVHGEIKVMTFNELCGVQCQTMTEKDFFDKNVNYLWKVGNIGGGGPGYTVDKVNEVQFAGKRAILRIYHPTKEYESVGPNQITYAWYTYLNTPANEVLVFEFNYNTDGKDKNRIDEFYKILDTFKFTN